MFHTHTKNDLVWLTSDVLENDAVTHGFSTRKGGVSPAPWDSLNLDDRRGDDIANVQENFRRLCAALDTDVQRAVLSRQVHRSDVRRVTAKDCGKGLWRPQDYDSADGLVTDVPGIHLGLQLEGLVLCFQNRFLAFLFCGLDRFVHQTGGLGFRAADLGFGGLFTVVVTNKIACTDARSKRDDQDHDPDDRGHRISLSFVKIQNSES